MSTPLLATKLFVAQTPPDVVTRLRVLARLQSALAYPLTLIAAPAGFGKTTLIAEWLHTLTAANATPQETQGQTPAVAWLSLDEGDNDPVRFWSYVAATLEKICPGVGASIQTMLQSPRSPLIEAVLTPLLNRLAEQTQTILLVLDDYQVIQNQILHDTLCFLIDHLPANVHLILLSRSDPPLPLARWRAQRRLLEIRTLELRFTQAETTAFLQKMGLTLTPTQVAQLETRTEGWVAGLQLAALSLQGDQNVADFLAGFTGSNRYIVDYLIDEVLQRQPAPLQQFLLQTSILDRLTPALCDTVTEQSASRACLAQLERNNLFLIPLDTNREWWRYHRLFADVLRNRVRQEQPAMTPIYHRRAAVWYAAQALPAEAIQHALLAQDFTLVCQLIEQYSDELLKRGETTTLQGWLDQLPLTIRRASPRLCLVWAYLMFHSHRLAEAEMALQEATQLVTSQADASSDAAFFAEIFALQALIAMNQQDFAQGIELAQRALLALPKDKVYIRGIITIWLGMIYCWKGDLAQAYQANHSTIEASLHGGDLYTAVVATSVQASVLEEWGELHKAAAMAQQALELAKAHNVVQMPIVGAAYNRLAEYLYEWNQLDEARRYLTQAIERLEYARNPRILLLAHVQMAKTVWAQGEKTLAYTHLQRASQTARDHHLSPWYVSLMVACQVNFWLAEQNLAAATMWAEQSGLGIDDDEAKLSAEERSLYHTFVRVLLAQGKLAAALHLLARLIPLAEMLRRGGRVIELLALSAIAHQARGDVDQAQAALSRALTLAEPEGYLRTFIDLGEPMQSLLLGLRKPSQRSLESTAHAAPLAYIEQLLAAFDPTPAPQPVQPPAAPSAKPQAHPQNLVERLSERELEVLRLVADGASNQQIATALIITSGTVKRHVSNIMGKLGVANRTHAVVRARELGLL